MKIGCFSQDLKKYSFFSETPICLLKEVLESFKSFPKPQILKSLKRKHLKEEKCDPHTGLTGPKWEPQTGLDGPGTGAQLSRTESRRPAGSEWVYILIPPHSLFFPDCKLLEPWNTYAAGQKSEKSAHLRVRQDWNSIATSCLCWSSKTWYFWKKKKKKEKKFDVTWYCNVRASTIR